ncbi:hypothetical protein L209DRAFT_746222 [Thermothelomyces heterothallicus CBS 203.75]
MTRRIDDLGEADLVGDHQAEGLTLDSLGNTASKKDLRHDLTVYLVLLDDRVITLIIRIGGLDSTYSDGGYSKDSVDETTEQLARAPRSKEGYGVDGLGRNGVEPDQTTRGVLFGELLSIDNRSSTLSKEAIAVDVNTAGLLVPRDSLGLPMGLPYISVIEEVANGGISSRGLYTLIEQITAVRPRALLIPKHGVTNLVTTAAKSVVNAYIDLKFCRDLLKLVLVNFALLTKQRDVEIRRALAKNLGPYYYGCSDLDFGNRYIAYTGRRNNKPI